MKRLVMLILALSLSLFSIVHAQEYGLLWKYEAGGSVNSVAITPDGEHIIAGSKDNNVYLFVPSQIISKIIRDTKSTISQIKSKYNISEAESLLSQG